MRFLLAFFFFVFHQFLYWVMARALLGQQWPSKPREMLILGVLNAWWAFPLFHFLDRLRLAA